MDTWGNGGIVIGAPSSTCSIRDLAGTARPVVSSGADYVLPDSEHEWVVHGVVGVDFLQDFDFRELAGRLAVISCEGR